MHWFLIVLSVALYLYYATPRAAADGPTYPFLMCVAHALIAFGGFIAALSTGVLGSAHVLSRIGWIIWMGLGLLLTIGHLGFIPLIGLGLGNYRDSKNSGILVGVLYTAGWLLANLALGCAIAFVGYQNLP